MKVNNKNNSIGVVIIIIDNFLLPTLTINLLNQSHKNILKYGFSCIR